MKKIISIFLLIVLTTNIGFAQIVDNISNNDNNNVVINLENENNQNNINNEEIQKLIDTYQDDINKIIKKEKKQMGGDKFYNYRDKLSDYGYDYFEYKKYDSYEPVIATLTNGDFVVWHTKQYFMPFLKGKKKKKIQYAAEYHADGTFMGIVRMKKVNKTTSAFFEYRKPESYPYDEANLKHIMIYFNKDVSVTFVLTADGNVRGVLYNDQLFSKDLENIVNIGKLNMSSLDKSNIAYDVVNVTGTSIYASAFLVYGAVGVPIGLLFFPIWMYMFMTNPT